MAEIFKRGDVWWLSYWVHGERVRKSLKTRSKHVANREKQAIEAELSKGYHRAAAEKNPAVGVFWAKYLDWANDHKRPRSIDTAETAWRYLVEFTKVKKVGDITPADIEAFKKSRRGRGNTPTTVNNFLRDIQAVINRGIKLGLYTGANPVVGVERYKVERREPEFHTEEDLNRLLEAATARGQALEWTVLLGAGQACGRWRSSIQSGSGLSSTTRSP